MPPTTATTEAGATEREQPAPAEVESYAERGMALWRDCDDYLRTGLHRRHCPCHCGCLCCSDAREALGLPALMPELACFVEER
jgi:hypothetical protein